MTVKIQANVQWRAMQTSARTWVGVCDPMNLAVEAGSLDELHSVIAEAIHLLMIDLLEDNELDAFLQERGWHAINMPAHHDGEDVRFDVPWELLVAGGMNDPERRPH